MSTMFLGKELTPVFESIWHGMPHSKHSNTSYWGVAAPDPIKSLLDCALFLRVKPV